MKKKQIKPKDKKNTRLEIMRSALASFRIEGINISNEMAMASLQKVETSLGK